MYIRMAPPPNYTASYLSIDGQEIQRAGDGAFPINAKYVLGLLQQGFSIAPDDILASTMAAVGSSGVVPGFAFFETTLNKPVWRSADNSSWVDATGTVVG